VSTVLFGGTLFLGAFLLFSLEPFVGKLMLPLLGGSPAVWNTCILFFQATLLMGYAWAHLGGRLAGERRHTLLHFALVLGALLLLPLHLRPIAGAPNPHNPVPWLLLTLTASVGLPFFVLAGSGPLLQRWFSRIRYYRAGDPYYLFAASNAGSLTGLLAYPSIVEPKLTLHAQALAWTAAFCLFVLLVLACVAVVKRDDTPAPGAMAHSSAGDAAEDPGAVSPGWKERARWVLLSAAPSSLLIGLTTYVTTDLAAIPLLWVVPLAIYLVTFILTFVQPPVLPHGLAVRWQPLLAVPLILFLYWGPPLVITVWLPFHLLVFFGTATMCHDILASSRPSADRLTEFYLWIAVGGALGGVFNVLVAPNLFDTVLEYPLVLALACALAPGSRGMPVSWRHGREVAASLVALVAIRLVVERLGDEGALEPSLVIGLAVVASGLAAVAVYRQRRQPLVLSAGLAAIVLAGYAADASAHDVLLRDRDFFGVRKIIVNSRDGTHVLLNGITKHGAQSFEPHLHREPLSYYGRAGPLGDVFAELPRVPRAQVGVVGLGTGAMAAYARPNDHWTFFELDPEIQRIATDQRYFTYLADSPAPIRVVLGDGRLSLSAEPDSALDLLVLDAFSSDAIPVHLLTREALQLYVRKLAPGGVLLFHLSNRYVSLESVLASLVREAGLSGRIRYALGSRQHLTDASVWAVVARSEQDLGGLPGIRGWTTLRDTGDPVWSDEFSNVLRAMRAFRR